MDHDNTGQRGMTPAGMGVDILPCSTKSYNVQTLNPPAIGIRPIPLQGSSAVTLRGGSFQVIPVNQTMLGTGTPVIPSSAKVMNPKPRGREAKRPSATISLLPKIQPAPPKEVTYPANLLDLSSVGVSILQSPRKDQYNATAAPLAYLICQKSVMVKESEDAHLATQTPMVTNSAGIDGAQKSIQLIGIDEQVPTCKGAQSVAALMNPTSTGVSPTRQACSLQSPAYFLGKLSHQPEGASASHIDKVAPCGPSLDGLRLESGKRVAPLPSRNVETPVVSSSSGQYVAVAAETVEDMSEEIARTILAKRLLGKSGQKRLLCLSTSNTEFPDTAAQSGSTMTTSQMSFNLATEHSDALERVDNVSQHDGSTIVFEHHAMSLLEKLNVSRENGDYCDLIVQIGEKQWKCHSVVFGAMCPMMHSLIQMLSKDSSLARRAIIDLPPAIDKQCFSAILDMMYTGSLSIVTNTVEKLLTAAAYLELGSVQKECEKYLFKTDGDAAKKISDAHSVSESLRKPSIRADMNWSGEAQSVRLGEDVIRPSSDGGCVSEEMGKDMMESSPTHNERCEGLMIDENAYDSSGGADDPVDDTQSISVTNCRQGRDADKPTSSLTNLVRVASEAYKDLGQQALLRKTTSSEDIGKMRLSDKTGNDSPSSVREVFTRSKCSAKDEKRLTGATSSYDSDNEHRCKQCDRIFTTQKRLLRHKGSHMQKCHKCNYCPKTFAKMYDCKVHERRKHTKEKPYTCSQCGKGFYLNRDLKQHAIAHEDGSIRRCKICDKLFETEAGYKIHVASHGEKKFECRNDACDRTFATITLRNRHEKAHKEEKKFQCQFCHKRFQTKDVLLRHKKIHTGEKPFKCEECGRAFPRAEHLRIHMSTHSDERKFQCDICKSTFKQRSGLNLHKLKHDDNLNFVCDVCGYKCRAKSALMQHSMCHSSERPFKCDICDVLFKLKKNLVRHQKIHQRKGETDAESYKSNKQKRAEKVKSKPKPLFYSTVQSRRRQKNIVPDVLSLLPLPTNLQVIQGNSTVKSGDSQATQNSCVSIQRETSTPSSLDLGGNEGLFESLSSTVPLMMPNQLTGNPSYMANKDIYFQSGDEPETSSWECSAGQMQALDQSHDLTQGNYLPVLTAEEILEANGDNVHFSG